MTRPSSGVRASRRLGDALGTFLSAEIAGGVVLLGATLAALAWANSPAAGSYEELWRTRISIRVGEQAFVSLDLRHWVNDALMALFFFVVGIEIKRELVDSSGRRRRAPLALASPAESLDSCLEQGVSLSRTSPPTVIRRSSVGDVAGSP